MRLGRSPSPNSNRTRVVVLTADAEFDRSVRATFGASSAIELTMVSGRIAERSDKLDVENATVVVVDLDAGSDEEMAALARLLARVAAGGRGDAELRRKRRPHAVADADRRLPGEAGGGD